MVVPHGAYLEPATDWVSVSLPSDSVLPVLDDLRSIVSAAPGVSAFPVGDGWLFPSGGLLQVRSRSGAFSTISFSGAVLASLRAAGLYGDCLRVLGSEPHRLTRLDVALDVLVHAPPCLQGLYGRAVRGEFSLTRKSFDPDRHISRYLGPGPGGEETGTVYLGTRFAEVKARVYDKRKERISKGCADPGPWLRAELGVTGKMGVSLKDAWEPAPVFWHFMESALQGVIERPGGVPCWKPGGEGFCLPPRPVRDPVQVLRRRLEQSRDLRDVCGLARDTPGGSVLVYRQMERHGLPRPFEVSLVPGFLRVAANGPEYDGPGYCCF